MKVLVTDDNTDNRDFVVILMESQGHTVVQAANGMQALDLARADPPDLVISDVLMPEMDGFLLCQVMKRSESLRHIPIVFYTATYVSAEDEALGYALGASRYLLKPLEPRTLLENINAVMAEASDGELTRTLPARDDLTLAHTYQQRISEKLDKKSRDVNRLNRERAMLLAATDEGIMGIDIDGRHTMVNAAAAALVGYDIDEMIGESAHMLWHHSHADGSEFPEKDCPILDSINNGHVHRFIEDTWWRKDGSAMPVEYSSTPIVENESIKGVVVVFRDITRRKETEASVRRTQTMLERTERIARTGSWEWNVKTDEVFWSTETYRFFGRDPALGVPNLAGQQALYTPEDAQRLMDVVSQAVTDGKRYDIELCAVRPDGERRYCRILGVPQRDINGKVELLAGSLQDITELRQAQARQKLAASVFTHAREGIVITDAEGNIIDVNAMFSQITGYSRRDVLGKNPRILQSGRQNDEFYDAMWQTLTSQGFWSGEIWNRRKNGEEYAETIAMSAVYDEQGNTLHYVALFSDITESKQHQKELERIAHYDVLTGLPNRLLLGDQLRQILTESQSRKKSFAVAYLDLDSIKTINDNYGHEAGDAVLIAVSQALQNTLREGDILARLGGDEFVAVLADLKHTDECIPIIEKLLEAACRPIKLPDSVEGEKAVTSPIVQVSASIGVTIYPEDNVDADVLLRHTDQAMYQAKQAGKNRYHLFDIATNTAIHSRQKEIRRISKALVQNEFVLYYQPKVNMHTGEVAGAEALIRWQHPERGLVPPGLFLPIIEEHPVSIDLGEWVITAALAQMTSWLAQGLELVISVNIGAMQLQQSDFPERLSEIMAFYPDVKPANLQLEILETSALADMTKVSNVMHACRAMGLRFAIDDFGTGYSSLTYLKHLPADVLKIDQSFVRRMTEEPDDLAIVKGVIGLANVFHRQVIAEGVETKMHGDLLLGIGCDLAQGYGIAKPMPAKDLPDWVAQWQKKASWTA